MHKAGFYPKMAAQGIRLNRRYYLPYVLTCIGSAALFYILFFLSCNPGVQELRGSAYVVLLLNLGTVVVGLFSLIMLFYTNSFLIRRRKQELGLYMVLGMEKRHIAGILFWEALFTLLLTLAGGLAVGILLSKLMLLLLCAALRGTAPFGFMVSVRGICWTCVVFFGILFLCFLRTLRQMHSQKPVELLHSENLGEREPKSRWLPAVLGLLALGGGYTIALMVRDAVSALILFFGAVILVIIGTYLLFLAGSIVVLKLLRRNKGFYYRTDHFISVSGMLHRMKRNAAGLASICILSTMVLVTVSTTVALYAGTEDVMDMMYPRDVQYFLYLSDAESMYSLKEQIAEKAEELDIPIEDLAWACYYIGENDLGSRTYIRDTVEEYMATCSGNDILRDDGSGFEPYVYVGFDLPEGTDVQAATEELDFRNFEGLNYEIGSKEISADFRDEVYGMLGGFFFIGMLLGFLFLMATALILYYKQVSEGYEDARGYRIMQQVGLSRTEVRKSIVRQIMTVFFLPLAAAALHIVFAFPMISKLLMLFSLNDIRLFALCTAGTFAVFALIYCAIYRLTAGAYYKIVKT